MNQFRLLKIILAGGAMLTAFAQTPVINAPTTPTGTAPSPVTVPPNTALQTETVDITDLAAYPPAITRASGPFILHLINKTHWAPPVLQWVVGADPDAVVQATALASSLNLTTFAHLQRQLSIVNLSSGTYTLRNAAGKIYLTITIQ